MTRPMWRLVILSSVLLACGSQARANIEKYDYETRYCKIKWYDWDVDNTNDYWYFFDPGRGGITLRRNGDWLVEYHEYEESDPYADVPWVNSGPFDSGVFKCTVKGASIDSQYGGIDFSTVTTPDEADLYVILEGAVPDGRPILAPHMSFTAEIEGSVAGPIEVRDIRRDDPYLGCVIAGSLAGDNAEITVHGDIDADAEFDVGSDCAASITIEGDAHGPIIVGGDCAAAMTVGGDVDGSIAVGGDCPGIIGIGGDVHGPITVGQALTGQILVSGSLRSNIEVGSIDLDTGAVAIDWDGWHVGDHWQPGVYVFVNGTPYGINSPEQRVYRITKCKGDVDNDGDVDQVDADLFDSALSNLVAFGQNHPAFYGSLVFHGDLDCDGDLDEDDSDLFPERIAAGACESTCAAGGACCFTDGACIFLTSDACATYGGYFWGEDATCETNPCLNGQVVVWGRSAEGQSPFPSDIPNTGFVAVAGGYYHSLALRHDGSIVAWGSNTDGQCSIPSANTGFAAVAAGAFHSVGLKAGGSVVAWGAGDTGDPVDVWPHFGQSIDQQGEEGNPFVAIAAGDYHSLAVKSNGSILAWGAGESGETGDYHFGQSIAPYPNTGFVAVAGGSFHSLGRKSNDSVVAWGAGEYGETGLYDFGQSIVPQNTSFQAIAANYYYSLGLTTDGSIAQWGAGPNGKPTSEDFVAIAAGVYHALALENDGESISIVAWGADDEGQSTVPSAGPGFVYASVASGAYHSLAIKQPTGACCKDGVCTQVTESYCNGDGGDWYGGGFECREVLHGDANCDGAVNFDDINPFVLALVGRLPYESRFPSCFWLSGDTDGSGTVNFDDINPFVGQLVNPTCWVWPDTPGARASVGLESAVASESSTGNGIEVRIWVTTANPTAAGVAFLPGYGPFASYATGLNDSGEFDVHQIGYLSEPVQEGSLDGDQPTFSPMNLTVEEPADLPEGTPVYVWATFCGPATGFPPGMGSAPSGTKIQGLNLTLVTTGSLVAEPHWYQVQDIGGATRWEAASDMTGTTVTMVGVNSWAWQNAAVATDSLQNALTISRQTGGAILLGAINVTGGGSLYVGLGSKGIFSPSGTVTFFPGTEEDGIEASTCEEGSPPRVGETAEASWSE